MLINLSRSDLEQVRHTETIHLTKHMLIERYQHVGAHYFRTDR